MRLRNWICLIATMLACGMISFAQDAKPTVKREPAAMTSPASAKEMLSVTVKYYRPAKSLTLLIEKQF